MKPQPRSPKKKSRRPAKSGGGQSGVEPPLEKGRWYSLEGKTVWVTGGAGYFGSAITAELDSVCAKVICFDLGNRAAELVKQRSLVRTVPISQDLAISADLKPLIESTVAAHGVPDGLVHLTFASVGAGKAFVDLPAKDFQKTFDLALPPTFVFCRDLAERMKARGSGSVVLFCSMYGLVSPDPRNYPEPMKPNTIDYGASKAALLQMCKYMAVHYGPSGVRFNCVTPGAFPHPPLQKSDPEFIRRLSERTPLRRIGQNPEIVGPVLFLLTDSASYVTGQNLIVDGGWTAW